MMSRLKLDVPGPIRAGCNIWVLLLEDRNLEMVLKGRPWSDFSRRITYPLTGVFTRQLAGREVRRRCAPEHRTLAPTGSLIVPPAASVSRLCTARTRA